MYKKKSLKLICKNCSNETDNFSLLTNTKGEVELVSLCDWCKAELMDLLLEYAWVKGGEFEKEIATLYEKYLDNTLGEYFVVLE